MPAGASACISLFIVFFFCIYSEQQKRTSKACYVERQYGEREENKQ